MYVIVDVTCDAYACVAGAYHRSMSKWEESDLAVEEAGRGRIFELVNNGKPVSSTADGGQKVRCCHVAGTPIV